MREKVGVASELVHVYAVLLPVCQAPPNEGLKGGTGSMQNVKVSKYKSLLSKIFTLVWTGHQHEFTYLCFIAGNRLDRELDVCSFEYGVLLQDVLL